MRLVTHPAIAAFAADGGGSGTDLGKLFRARAPGMPIAPTPEERRVQLFARGEAVPTIGEKRRAAAALRRAYDRIDADFSEAYEQCRTDAQRKAIEDAHRAAKRVVLRAEPEDSLEDRMGWQSALADHLAERARLEPKLSGLEGATAIARILTKLGAIAGYLTVLAA